uniref:Gag-pol protein n=1 Tax=Solanum tuberosum TaxID=4113 RepID=M1DQB5_SOLTU
MTSAIRPSSVSSSFRACLPHLHVLDHWAGFAYWNKGQSKSLRRIANLSSSTYCTWIIILAISISSISIAALPSLLDRRDNPATNKLILLLMSTTIGRTISLRHASFGM